MKKAPILAAAFILCSSSIAFAGEPKPSESIQREEIISILQNQELNNQMGSQSINVIVRTKPQTYALKAGTCNVEVYVHHVYTQKATVPYNSPDKYDLEIIYVDNCWEELPSPIEP